MLVEAGWGNGFFETYAPVLPISGWMGGTCSTPPARVAARAAALPLARGARAGAMVLTSAAWDVATAGAAAFPVFFSRPGVATAWPWVPPGAR